jgi:hypothetical protein
MASAGLLGSDKPPPTATIQAHIGPCANVREMTSGSGLRGQVQSEPSARAPEVFAVRNDQRP